MATNIPGLDLTGRIQYRGDASKRQRQDSNEEDVDTVPCQKCETIVKEKIRCSGCKLLYCLKCAHVSQALYKCILNGELENFHWTCMCCKEMFPTLDNISTTLQNLHANSEQRMNNLEDRMSKLEKNSKDDIKESISNMKEEILESVKSGIDKLVDDRNKELEDRRRRDLNLAVFNLPEPSMGTGQANKSLDDNTFKQICSSLGLENVNIVASYRLGRRKLGSIRPYKLTLSDKVQRKFILENARFIPQKLPPELRTVVITKDLTPLQRKERKERRQARQREHQERVTTEDNVQPRGSPQAMELGAAAPSPISRGSLNLTHLHDESRFNPDSYNQTTILEETVVGGQPVTDSIQYVFNDPGSPV